MQQDKCGVCNRVVPDERVALHRIEKDDTITSYHMACGGKSKEIKPCDDCGRHKLVCDDCKD